jgi:hypothetical protein
VRATTLVAVMLLSAAAGTAYAQPAGNGAEPGPGVACPPDVKSEPPTVGGGPKTLSDKLAQSKGVICPPSEVDRDMQVAPPAGGRLKVIRPPGTPGGDQSVQPK